MALFTTISGIVYRESAYVCTRIWAFLWLKSSGVKLKVNGLKNLDVNSKYIMISNHLSSLDIPVVVSSLTSEVVFIAKQELFNIPILGRGMKTAGHIPIDRSSARKGRESIQRAADMIREGNRSVLIFPEGTRGVEGNIGEFKQASFTLVKKSGVQMLPIFIRGTDRVSPKGKILINPGVVEVNIGTPIPSSVIEKSDKAGLKNMALKQILDMQERSLKQKGLNEEL